MMSSGKKSESWLAHDWGGSVDCFVIVRYTNAHVVFKENVVYGLANKLSNRVQLIPTSSYPNNLPLG